MGNLEYYIISKFGMLKVNDFMGFFSYGLIKNEIVADINIVFYYKNCI